MKTSLVFLALALSGVVKAQTGFAEFPYNPDSDGDDFIGITDLLSLLSLYESEFSEEGLYLTSDSTEALYYTGNKTYAQCHKSCHDLPGKWWIPHYEEILSFDLSLPVVNATVYTAWIQSDIPGQAALTNEQHGRGVFVGVQNGQYSNPTPSDNGRFFQQPLSGQLGCMCFTRERPKVEYAICSSSSITEVAFVNCLSERTSDGWLPLGSIDIAPNMSVFQSFWRWKE